MGGLVGLIGEVTPKSMLARVWSWSLVGPWVVGAVEAEGGCVVCFCGLLSRAEEAVAVVVFVFAGVWGGDFAIGRDKPLSFPRLATPTPQVNVVRYPEHSLPKSIH
jgi:hypothetical protein